MSKFIAKGSSVYLRKAQVTIRNRRYDVDIRIDGRNASVFRVDVKSFPFEPWQAIDGGPWSAPTTLAEAKCLADHWIDEVNAQQTLSVNLCDSSLT